MPSATTPARKARYDRNIAYIDSKRNVPCHDCGGTFPLVCMDLHHIEEGTKMNLYGTSIKNALKTMSRQRIDEELNKCVVLCACCHRIRHQ